jgi:hypothetical protein
VTSDEGMMNAARIMREAAESNRQSASRIEDALRLMQIIFDPSYGGVAPQLLERLTTPAAAPAECNPMDPERSMTDA